MLSSNFVPPTTTGSGGGGGRRGEGGKKRTSERTEAIHGGSGGGGQQPGRNEGMNDVRIVLCGGAMSPFSLLLLVMHFFATIELTEDAGCLEIIHQAMYWCATYPPQAVRNFGILER